VALAAQESMTLVLGGRVRNEPLCPRNGRPAHVNTKEQWYNDYRKLSEQWYNDYRKLSELRVSVLGNSHTSILLLTRPNLLDQPPVQREPHK
jgi:hypothetical protein